MRLKGEDFLPLQPIPHTIDHASITRLDDASKSIFQLKFFIDLLVEKLMIKRVKKTKLT